MIIPIILAALFVGMAFYRTDWLVRQQAIRVSELKNQVQLTRIHWLELQQQIGVEMTYLHTDYGEAENLLSLLQQDIEQLQTLLQGEKTTEITLKNLFKDLEQAAHFIERYHTLHAVIKNSTQQLPRLLTRYLTQHPHPHRTASTEHETSDRTYLALLSQAVSEVVLTSTSLDLDLAPSLKELIDQLENATLPGEEDRPFNELFRRHLQVIYANMPGFLLTGENLQNLPFSEHLDQLEQQVHQLTDKSLDKIGRLHLALAIAFMLILLFTGWLLIRMNNENRRLQAVREALDLSVISDTLTGLPNRQAWNQREVKGGTVLLFNIDRFKNINDFYGSEAGDAVLVQFSRLLTQNLDAMLSSCIYRVGGDDFAVLLPPDCSDSPANLARRVVMLVEQQPFDINGRPIPVSISVGISRHDPLLETADLALKAVKTQRIRVKEYDPKENLQKAVEHNLQMVDTLRKALREERVVAWYQPLLNNHTGRVDKYECLMRIQEEDGSTLNPGQFLDVAREARLLGQLTCNLFLQALPYMEKSSMGFSINLSMSDMLDSQVTELLQTTLENNPELAHRITLEILETEEVADTEAVEQFLHNMRHLGCKLAIDDFGSGYSNLSQVLSMNVDQLKIDASLIRNLDASQRALDTVRAILQFARAANIPSVVAEHVSSHRIQKIVEQLGIDYSQGFWVGKPEPELLPEEMLLAENLHHSGE